MDNNLSTMKNLIIACLILAAMTVAMCIFIAIFYSPPLGIITGLLNVVIIALSFLLYFYNNVNLQYKN
jgi:multisubunit Na+/H+ antiporter MnhB subunit